MSAPARPPWLPDWAAMRRRAPEVPLDAGEGYLYLVADAHLGAPGARPADFLAMLAALERPRAVVFLGDLFQVWLALPRFWDAPTREVLAGFARLRHRGVPLVFVMGNREYFLPDDPAEAARRGLPFDHIVHEACILRWGGRRYVLTHGDVVNRRDSRYLRWRRFSRSRGFEAAFRALPGPVARGLSRYLERTLARSNREVKITYPRDELEAFADVMVPGLDGCYIGHFHRDETVAAPGGGGTLRIVPDWFSRKTVLRLDAAGREEAVAAPGGIAAGTAGTTTAGGSHA